MMGKLRRNAATPQQSPRNEAPSANLYNPTSYEHSSSTDSIISTTRQKRIYISVIAVLLSVIVSVLLWRNVNDITPLLSQINEPTTKKIKNAGKDEAQLEYKGTLWRTDRTVQVDNVAETPFARCDVHHVRSEDGTTIVHDWIFMEEMDAVNVAVVDAGGKFVVFEQEKYAIPGSTLSPVGGFIDAGEAPWEAARREVKEELGLGSGRTLQRMRDLGYDPNDATGGRTEVSSVYDLIPKTERIVDRYGLAEGIVSEDELDDWVFLGRYRTAANRGGGFIYTYLLKNAVPLLPKGGTADFVPVGDDEAQKILFLTMDQVLQSVLEGKFQEVKWAATMANSLLHMKLQ